LPSGKVLVAGGYDGASGLSFNTTVIYDPFLNSWTDDINFTDARSGHTANVLQDGRVIIIAGSTNGGQLASTEIYDEGTAGSAPIADFSASAVSITEGQSITFTDLSTNSPTSLSWTFQGGNPGTSTSSTPVITYDSAGIYDVTLDVFNAFGAGSLIISEYITVDSVGTTRIAGLPFKVSSINIFPNPTKGILSITFDGTGEDQKAIVKIYNINSRLVHKTAINPIQSNSQQINLRHQPPGVYFVELEAGDVKLRKKIILVE